MARIALAANDGWSVVNFRGSLIRALIGGGHEVSVIAPDGPHSDSIRALGAGFHPLPMQPRGQSPAADLLLLWRYRRLLRALAPDAMLGFTAKPNIWGSIAAHSLGIKVINNISGLGTAFIQGGRLERLVSALYRFALSGSSTVFFQNGDDRALFVQRGLVEPSKTSILPGSGVDLGHFAAAPWPDGPFTFLLPARMIWDKGIAEYAEAAHMVRERMPGRDVRFVLLGAIEPPTPQSVPRSWIDDFNGRGLVEYAGATRDVRPHFAAAHCIVLPSYREGTPRSLLEAGAIGRPSVTTDVPGCRDVIVDGETGMLCEPRSAASLADAMQRMLELAPARQQAMGAAARKRVERVYDDAIVHRAYRDALLTALA